MMFVTLIASKITLSAQTQAALLFESAAQQLENVDWSTMFGGQGEEGFEGSAAGMSNDVYVVGSHNTSYVIQNSGEQIGSASFFNDAYLVKFDENCVASFISYYGGSSGVDKFIANTAPRAFIAAFRPSGEMLWSTPYGMGDNNSARDICTNGNKVWIVGSSNKDWTFEQYNQNSDDDYYREVIDPHDDLPEATIARFDIPQIVGIQDGNNLNEKYDQINIYPNHTNGRITIDLRYSAIEGQFDFKVINSLGEIVKSEQLTATKGVLEYEIFDLAPGVYQMVFLANGITHSTSFVKN